jgi:hypothetical protein
MDINKTHKMANPYEWPVFNRRTSPDNLLYGARSSPEYLTRFGVKNVLPDKQYFIGKSAVIYKSPPKKNKKKIEKQQLGYNEMYCVKCREKKFPNISMIIQIKLQNPKKKNGVPAISAPCPTCQTKMVKIVNSSFNFKILDI